MVSGKGGQDDSNMFFGQPFEIWILIVFQHSSAIKWD